MNPRAKILALAATAALLATAACGEKGNRMAAAFNRRLNPPPWRQRVAMALDREDADNRRMGINYMAPDTKPSDTGTLKLFAFILANDRDQFVRAAAVTALATVGNTDFTPDVIAALNDASEVVRWDAAKALRTLVVDDALEPLIARAVSDPSTNVRIAATQSLASYRKRRSVRTLLQLMDIGDLSVRRAAHQSLVEIYRLDLGDQPEAWADTVAGDIPPAPTQAQLDAKKSWWQRFRQKRQNLRDQRDAQEQADQETFLQDYQQRLQDDTQPDERKKSWWQSFRDAQAGTRQRQNPQDEPDLLDLQQLLPPAPQYVAPGQRLPDDRDSRDTQPTGPTSADDSTEDAPPDQASPQEVPDAPQPSRDEPKNHKTGCTE